MPSPTPHEAHFRIVKIGLLLLAIAVPLAVWLIWREEIGVFVANRELAPVFEKHVQGLYEKAEPVVKAAGGYNDTPPPPPEPARRGPNAVWIQVQVIAHSNRYEYVVTLDDDFGRVPADMRAESPAKAETAVLLFPKSARVGHYVPVDSRGDPTQGAPVLSAFVEVLDVHVVDLKSNRYLGRKRFQWNPKQRVDLLKESHIQERNSKEVVAWYTALSER